MQPQPIPQGEPRSVVSILDENRVVGQRKTGSKRFWTTTELRIIDEVYPTAGPEACVEKLPGRSAYAIYQRAMARKLKAPGPNGPRAERVVRASTPELDEAIKHLLLKPATRQSTVKAFAKTIGKPYRWVISRGRKLVPGAPRFKEPDWSKEEIEYLQEFGHLSEKVIARRMSRKGWPRSATAIKVKLKRLAVCRDDPDHLTARGLAEMMGVDGKTVCVWVQRGYLPETKSERNPAAHWFHRRVIRKFLIEHRNLIDLRKVDKDWFIETLAAGHIP